MSACDREGLPAFALDGLTEAEHRRMAEHIAGCEACAGELDELRAAASRLAEDLAPVPPAPELRQRVLASTRRGRFDGFARAFADMFDVVVERARELLDLVDRPGAWEPGPGPGTALIHFTAGPATAGADTGFVRVDPGVRFPWHRHGGLETNLVLQGGCTDADGTRYRRGDVFVNQPGSEHDFRADDGGDYIYAVVVYDVDFDVDRPG